MKYKFERICWVDLDGLNSKYLPSNYDWLIKFAKGKYSNGDCSIETKIKEYNE